MHIRRQVDTGNITYVSLSLIANFEVFCEHLIEGLKDHYLRTHPPHRGWCTCDDHIVSNYFLAIRHEYEITMGEII
jgi:hypothetical protein